MDDVLVKAPPRSNFNHLEIGDQIPFDLGHRIALGRDDFLIAPSNQAAVGLIDRWPDWNNAPALILTGPPGSGKSHLAAVWKEKTGAVDVKPGQLLSHYAEEIARAGHHICLDGLDPWLGENRSETTLFHLYNMFKEQKRTMILTMRMDPSQAHFSLPDLASRLRSVPLAVISAPDDELLAALIVKQFADRQILISEDVIRYLLPRIERSFEEIQKLVKKADKMALSQKRSISIPLMRDVLDAMQRDNQPLV